ncbi:MAG TPA: exodeoxyribonuclease V subunit gamma, partial [Actinomycetes bacterium]|nr:exodeoxyribonuclease V subunit gamma [Actinomycetes bacterium]
AALADHRDVHLWLHHSSPALWDAVAMSPPVLRRKDDASRSRLTNPLLTSLSRDVLELQQLVARCAPGSGTVLHESPEPPDTLLGRLTADLAADRVPDQPPPLDAADRSVQVHACPGRTRQVVVLRVVIVGLLADDPTLEPRDVLVMCPDVETFAPIIAATFAIGAEDDAAHPAARLRVRLADRALRQTNALLAVLSQLLELGTARLTASQVLDLAGTPAVRARFGFEDDALERLRDWTVGAAVRWGLDREHRATWQLGDLEQGSWRDGLDRLLLGATMEGALEHWHDVVPLDDVDSSDIDLAGQLAELVDRLAAAQALMSGRHTAAEWMAGLEDAVSGLAATTHETAWQLLQLRGELGDIAEAAEGSTALLGLADVRALLASSLAGRPTRASFRTGTLTVCTLVPMRSVPHRVVCLLGLDDGVFPRQSSQDGDDVLARDPWVGERDPRSEDRQLLLDAICAAEDHLVITYTGADERTGAPVPPAVPLGELLDALDRTAVVSSGRVREAVTTHHALQPFDPRNFEPGSAGRPFSFDPLGYAGARAAAGPRTEPLPVFSAPLPSRPAVDVDLADLRRLLTHPARGFLRQRLQVAETRGEDEPADALPVELDNLELWAVGERVLRERLAGLEPVECLALEAHRGDLPPGPLGEAALRDVGRKVEGIVAVSVLDREAPPESHDVDVPLPDGTRLVGTVSDVRGDVLLTLTYSRLAARHRLLAWIDLVALTVAVPDRPWRAAAVGRGRGKGALRSTFDPLDPLEARLALDELVALYRAGLRAPLPLPVKTAAAYAERRNHSDTPTAREGAEREWLRGMFPGEQDDAEHVLLYGAAAPLSVLTAQRPLDDEGGPGWHADETDRFGLLSRRLWGRLLDAESQVQT